jgi:hypothetical protein
MLVNVTLSVLLVSYLAGCSSTTAGLSIGTTNGTGESEQIPAKLFKPDGAGEFPAVVIMHDCSGLGPRSSGAPNRWAKELLIYGYVVLIPDSFNNARARQWRMHQSVSQPDRSEPISAHTRCLCCTLLSTHPAVRRQSPDWTHGRLARRFHNSRLNGFAGKR